MDTNAQKKHLIGQIHTFSDILRRRNVYFDVPSDEELNSMESHDLATLVRELRDVARTPMD